MYILQCKKRRSLRYMQAFLRVLGNKVNCVPRLLVSKCFTLPNVQFSNSYDSSVTIKSLLLAGFVTLDAAWYPEISRFAFTHRRNKRSLSEDFKLTSRHIDISDYVSAAYRY